MVDRQIINGCVIKELHSELNLQDSCNINERQSKLKCVNYLGKHFIKEDKGWSVSMVEGIIINQGNVN